MRRRDRQAIQMLDAHLTAVTNILREVQTIKADFFEVRSNLQKLATNSEAQAERINTLGSSVSLLRECVDTVGDRVAMLAKNLK